MYRVQITLVSAADQLVERTRIHQLVVGQTLKTYRISHLLRNSGVQFVQGVVTALHPNQHTVTVQSAAGTNSLAYDKLVYALGSFVDRSSLPGAAEHAFTLDLASAQQLRDLLPEVAKRGGRLVVIGAGLTGLEVVSEVAESYPTLQVSLLTGGTVGDDLSPKAANYVRSVLQKLSIKLYEQHKAVKIEESTLHCANGEAIPFDLAVYCGGFAVSPLAQNAGIAVNSRRQMVLDERLAFPLAPRYLRCWRRFNPGGRWHWSADGVCHRAANGVSCGRCAGRRDQRRNANAISLWLCGSLCQPGAQGWLSAICRCPGSPKIECVDWATGRLGKGGDPAICHALDSTDTHLGECLSMAAQPRRQRSDTA